MAYSREFYFLATVIILSELLLLNSILQTSKVHMNIPLHYQPLDPSLKHDTKEDKLANNHTNSQMSMQSLPNDSERVHRQDQEFQSVVPNKSWVFSAFYDNRSTQHYIVAIVIAVRFQGMAHATFCRISYQGGVVEIVPLLVELIPEGHELQ